MRGVFDDEELEQARSRRDRELTLGAGTLWLLFFALVLVCGVCFGLGYTVGHRNAQTAITPGQLPDDGEQPPLSVNGSPSKPSAAPVAAVAQPAQNASPTADAALPGAGALTQTAVAVVVPVTGQQPASPATTPSAQPQIALQPQVRPALPAGAMSPQPAAALSAHPVAGQFMVQIATVSHEEDADVLMAALHRRGYAVSARRDPAGNLIYVRIGPFNNRDEANRWRLRLLSDGYNALVQP